MNVIFVLPGKWIFYREWKKAFNPKKLSIKSQRILNNIS